MPYKILKGKESNIEIYVTRCSTFHLFCSAMYYWVVVDSIFYLLRKISGFFVLWETDKEKHRQENSFHPGVHIQMPTMAEAGAGSNLGTESLILGRNVCGIDLSAWAHCIAFPRFPQQEAGLSSWSQESNPVTAIYTGALRTRLSTYTKY